MANPPRALIAAGVGVLIKWMSRLNTAAYKVSGGKVGGSFLAEHRSACQARNTDKSTVPAYRDSVLLTVVGAFSANSRRGLLGGAVVFP